MTKEYERKDEGNQRKGGGGEENGCTYAWEVLARFATDTSEH